LAVTTASCPEGPRPPAPDARFRHPLPRPDGREVIGGPPLAMASKPKVVVATAIAREMVGFIWAIVRIAQPTLQG